MEEASEERNDWRQLDEWVGFGPRDSQSLWGMRGAIQVLESNTPKESIQADMME